MTSGEQIIGLPDRPGVRLNPDYPVMVIERSDLAKIKLEAQDRALKPGGLSSAPSTKVLEAPVLGRPQVISMSRLLPPAGHCQNHFTPVGEQSSPACLPFPLCWISLLKRVVVPSPIVVFWLVQLPPCTPPPLLPPPTPTPRFVHTLSPRFRLQYFFPKPPDLPAQGRTPVKYLTAE